MGCLFSETTLLPLSKISAWKSIGEYPKVSGDWHKKYWNTWITIIDTFSKSTYATVQLSDPIPLDTCMYLIVNSLVNYICTIPSGNEKYDPLFSIFAYSKWRGHLGICFNAILLSFLQKRMVHIEKSLRQSVNLSSKLELIQLTQEPIVLEENRYTSLMMAYFSFFSIKTIKFSFQLLRGLQENVPSMPVGTLP